jgi:hypothetical protein
MQYGKSAEIVETGLAAIPIGITIRALVADRVRQGR